MLTIANATGVTMYSFAEENYLSPVFCEEVSQERFNQILESYNREPVPAYSCPTMLSWEDWQKESYRLSRVPLNEVADRDCDTDPHYGGSLYCQAGASAFARSSVPSTDKDKLYSIKLDWLEFSFKDQTPELLVPLLLDLDYSEFYEETYSIQGFESLHTYGAVKVLYSPTKKNTPLKFILSAQALDQVGVDALKIVRNASNFDAIWVRIDIALDCKNDLFTMADIEEAVFQKKAVHKFRRITPRKDYNSKMESITNSITFGSPKGKRMLCIYDKQLERIDRGKDDPGTWVRIEGRWRSTTAKIVAATLLKVGLDAGYLLGIIDFRELDANDTNKDRRTRCLWWENFLDGCEPIKTGERKIPTTIEKKIEWISGKINATLGQVFVSVGMDGIKEIIKSGIRKTEKRDWIRLFGPNMEPNYFQQLMSV
jgi:hypothetical protein